MLESIDPVVLVGQVLQLIPLASLEVLEALVFLELLPQHILRTVLHLVLEL